MTKHDEMMTLLKIMEDFTSGDDTGTLSAVKQLRTHLTAQRDEIAKHERALRLALDYEGSKIIYKYFHSDDPEHFPSSDWAYDVWLNKGELKDEKLNTD